MPDTPIYKMARCEVQTHLLEQEATRTTPNIGLSAGVVLGRLKANSSDFCLNFLIGQSLFPFPLVVGIEHE